MRRLIANWVFCLVMVFLFILSYIMFHGGF
jgi:hypothetical protein